MRCPIAACCSKAPRLSGPRRLTLAVAGLPVKQKDVREELKGPKTDAPAAAIEGFLKKTGLTKDQLKVENTPKGDVYMALIEKPGAGHRRRSGRDRARNHGQAALAQIDALEAGRGDTLGAAAAFHPLHLRRRAGAAVASPASPAAGTTRGHRFLSEGSLDVRRFDDYEAALKKAHVILDAEERAAIIFEGDQIGRLCPWPGNDPRRGAFGRSVGPGRNGRWSMSARSRTSSWMCRPRSCRPRCGRIRNTSRCAIPKTGKMANKFALVANMIAQDGGKEIVGGNERVLRARLSDAKFFWDEDRKQTLESRVDDLKGIVSHAELGTQAERVARIEKLAGEIAGKIGADVQKAQACRPPGQGRPDVGCGGRISRATRRDGPLVRALHDKEDGLVADAIRDHYKPVRSVRCRSHRRDLPLPWRWPTSWIL